MKTLLTCSQRWFALGFVVAGLGALAPASVQAGESILFSREKPRTAPEKATLAPREGLDGKSRLVPLTPFDLDIPNQPQDRARGAQKDRKQKAAELEKKNWMVYSPGELQEQEEENEAFGIRDVSFDKEDGTTGGFFARKDDDKNRPRSPSQSGRPVAPGSRPPGDEATRNPIDDNASKPNNPENKEGRPADTSLKALLSKGSDLRLNLGSGKSGPDASDSSNLRSLVAGSADDRPLAPGSRPQNAADARLFSSPSSTFKPSGSDNISPGFSWRNDSSTKGVAPGFTSPVSRPANDYSGNLNNPASRNPGGNSLFPSGTDRNLNPNNVNAPGFNNPSSQPASPGGGLGTLSPYPQQPPPGPLQRSSRDTFSIPSR